jgi:hypothetical protein
LCRVRQLAASTMDPAETESYCREQHRMFVESMERYMGPNREGTAVGGAVQLSQGEDEALADGGNNDHHDGAASEAAAAASSSVRDSPGSPSGPWRRMAADLGWTVEQVQLHAYLYFAALCDDRRARKRKRRMERQSNDNDTSTSVGQEMPPHQQPTDGQGDQCRAAGGDVATAAVENRRELEESVDPASPRDKKVTETTAEPSTIEDGASGDSKSAAREPTTKEPTGQSAHKSQPSLSA